MSTSYLRPYIIKGYELVLFMYRGFLYPFWIGKRKTPYKNLFPLGGKISTQEKKCKCGLGKTGSVCTLHFTEKQGTKMSHFLGQQAHYVKAQF